MEKYTDRQSYDSLQIPLLDKSVYTELSGDFTLPDYQPEIKRLLQVRASVLPPSKYVGDNGASLAGGIDYYVLYTGSDNALYCAPLNAEYKVEIPFDGIEGMGDGYLHDLSCAADSVPDMLSARVLAPRKVSIKCRLKSRAQIFGEAVLENHSEDGEEGLQVLTCRLNAMRRYAGMSDMIRVTDEMILDGRDGEKRVISADGKILIGETAVSGGAVVCRGDLYLKLMLCGDDGDAPYVTLRKIPISGSVAIEGAVAGASASATGCLGELNITVEESRIGIEAGVLLEAEVCVGEEVSFVKDVYSVSRRAENHYKSLPVISDAVCFGGNFTLSDSLNTDEIGIAQGSRVIDVSGVAQTDETVTEGDICAAHGRVKLSMLCEKDGEYSVAETEVPFTYRVPISGEYDRAMAYAEVISSRARVDGALVGVDAEIAVSGMAMHCKKEKMVSEIGFGDPIERGRGETVVCYPSGEDTLWSVAKRYGALLESIKRANGIKSDGDSDSRTTLEGVKYLVI